MSLNRLTFSVDLKAKDLCYSDDFFKLKSDKIIPQDSFSFDSYEAFKNINDFKTNNYSNVFLINKQRNSEWLEPKVKKGDSLNGLATTISFFAADTTNEVELGSWLYFSKNYEMFDVNCTSVDAILTYGKPDTNYSNYIFYLEFIDDNTCRIAHTFGDIVFYLSATEDKHIKFLKNPKDGEEVFVYVIDGNVLRLFKNVLHKNYNEVGEVIKTYTGFYSLGVERGEDKGGELKLYDDIGDDSNVFAYVHDTSLDFNFYVDSSWVAYDRS